MIAHTDEMGYDPIHGKNFLEIRTSQNRYRHGINDGSDYGLSFVLNISRLQYQAISHIVFPDGFFLFSWTINCAVFSKRKLNTPVNDSSELSASGDNGVGVA
ncbi:MAG: hypothetical protein IT427_19025 [Pirellulales bacterium]|nr:hypothetical protein [Pirellulales bacterium]